MLCNDETVTDISGARRSKTYYYIDVPAGASNLSFTISGGSGDADIYVKYGSQPTTRNYDCRPYLNGNNETCNFSSVNEGRYHVMISGYSTYSGISLTASYDGGAASAANHSKRAKHYTHGKRIEANKRHELWMTKNADNTITLTHVFLASEEQLESAAQSEE